MLGTLRLTADEKASKIHLKLTTFLRPDVFEFTNTGSVNKALSPGYHRQPITGTAGIPGSRRR